MHLAITWWRGRGRAEEEDIDDDDDDDAIPSPTYSPPKVGRSCGGSLAVLRTTSVGSGVGVGGSAPAPAGTARNS